LLEQVLECEVHTRPTEWYTRKQPGEPLSWIIPKRRRAEAIVIRYGYKHALETGRKRGARNPAIVDLATELRFRALATEWKAQVRVASTPTQMFVLPSYQRIIGLGPAAIPSILHELRREPNHWFWALAALSGENPVSARDVGNVAAMADSWLRWGRERGYL
jgi:hypothetical protein